MHLTSPEEMPLRLKECWEALCVEGWLSVAWPQDKIPGGGNKLFQGLAKRGGSQRSPRGGAVYIGRGRGRIGGERELQDDFLNEQGMTGTKGLGAAFSTGVPSSARGAFSSFLGCVT